MNAKMKVKHAIITKHFNRFSKQNDYLLNLSEQQFNEFREIGLAAKEITNRIGDKEYFINVKPVPRDPMGKGMPKEDEFLVCYDIDIDFTVYEIKDNDGNVRAKRLYFTADDITDNNPLPKEKRCPVGNSVLFD